MIKLDDWSTPRSRLKGLWLACQRGTVFGVAVARDLSGVPLGNPLKGADMQRAVEFESEGATLSGRLYLPDDKTDPLPAFVMSHSTSTTVTMVANHFAEVFCKPRFAALLYDHCNFGVSDGEP